MNTFYNKFRQIYDEYLDYTQDNPPITIPYIKHDSELSIGKVHASALGRCPLASAKSRVEKVKHDFSTKHLMEQGKRDAAPIQEAMYKAGHSVEVSVEKDNLRGRLDILMDNNVVELKRRDIGYSKEGKPQPKLTDTYQMLAYSWMTSLPVHLCTFTRFNLYFWYLKPLDTGFVLLDEEDNEWKNFQNQPSYLNYGVVLAETKDHLRYLNGETEVPIKDYLNNPSGNECGHWESKERPKMYKTEYNGETERHESFVPHCANWCHGILPESGLISVREIGYDARKYEVVS